MSAHLARHRQPENSLLWGDGISGVILTILKAFEVYQDNRYLRAAESASEYLWSNIDLKNLDSPHLQLGLCKGVTGIAYTFLFLYKATQSIKYLDRANELAKAICRAIDPLLLLTPVSQRYSLMNGIPGFVLFLTDLSCHTCENFPTMSFGSFYLSLGDEHESDS